MTGYVFDNSWEQERGRLAGFEAHYDPGTIRYLETIGVAQGWRCLEIAAGAGSIARWLCDRVGSSGTVVATDIDTRFLEVLNEPNLDVRRHNLSTDDLPEEEFDLIHGRAIIEHLPDPDHTIKRLAAALKPGGWILLEDSDWTAILAERESMVAHPEGSGKTMARVYRAILHIMREAGYDEDSGRRLPGALIAQGLVDVGAEIGGTLTWGGSPAAASGIRTIERFREDLLRASLIKEAELDAAVASLADPDVAVAPQLMVSAWGRRPPGNGGGGGRGMPPRTETVRSWLRTSPLFAKSSEVEMSRVASLADELHVDAGEQLTVEGQPGSTFFVIAKGTATVTRGGKRLVGLGPGSYFGEIALLEQGPRTATVTADSRMWLFVFDAKGFASLMNGMPSVANEIFRALAERKRNVKRDSARG